MRWFKVLDNVNEKLSVGKTLRIKAGPLDICLARTNNGIYAVSNECTHLKALMHMGPMNTEDEIVCPWHSYRFSLKTGDETSGHGCEPLNVYALKQEDEVLWIELPL